MTSPFRTRVPSSKSSVCDATACLDADVAAPSAQPRSRWRRARVTPTEPSRVAAACVDSATSTSGARRCSRHSPRESQIETGRARPPAPRSRQAAAIAGAAAVPINPKRGTDRVSCSDAHAGTLFYRMTRTGGTTGATRFDRSVLASEQRGSLALFFELFLFGRAEACRRPKRLAMIVERQIAHVKRQRARWRLLVHDDGDGTAPDAVRNVMRQPQASRACVKPFIDRIISLGAPGFLARTRLFAVSPVCVAQILPSREITTVTGMPNSGPYASCTSSWSMPWRTG